MSARFVITYEGLEYAWSPSRSTPSAGKPIAELQEIVSNLKHGGARLVVEFGWVAVETSKSSRIPSSGSCLSRTRRMLHI